MSAQCAYDVWSSAYRLWAKKTGTIFVRFITLPRITQIIRRRYAKSSRGKRRSNTGQKRNCERSM